MPDHGPVASAWTAAIIKRNLAQVAWSPGQAGVRMHSGSACCRSPQPTERVRQDRAGVVRVVAAVSEHEAEVVPTLSERGSDAQVRAEPVELCCIPVEV